MTKLMTLADATDARHLADARAIVRERLWHAAQRCEVASWNLKRCQRLLKEAIKLNVGDDTINLYTQEARAAEIELETARIALQAM